MSVTTDKEQDIDGEETPEPDVDETEQEAADEKEQEAADDSASEDDGASEDDDVPAEETKRRDWRRRGAHRCCCRDFPWGAGCFGRPWLASSRAGHTGRAGGRTSTTSGRRVRAGVDQHRLRQGRRELRPGPRRVDGRVQGHVLTSSVQLRQLLIDNKASAHGAVIESAVQSASKDKVVVLLFVDQSVSNTSVPDPRVDRSRIKMTMEYVDGRWRANTDELP